MERSTRPQYHLDLENLPPLAPNQPQSTKSSATTSPTERAVGSTPRMAQGSSASLPGLNSAGSSRIGAGSPSHEYGSRMYMKRAREFQGSDKPSPSMWGPPTASGLSTPLRETIPESPSSDSFPDLTNDTNDTAPFARINTRSRAGTVPSRLPVGTGQNGSLTKSLRPTPTTSPFRPSTGSGSDLNTHGTGAARTMALLSRLRAGSMPQRSSFLSTQNSSPFGPSVFSSNWNSSRDQASTTQSSGAVEDITSLSQSALSRDGLADADVKTLDYLGLVDSPRATKFMESNESDTFMLDQRPIQPLLANLAALNRNSRFRSYSVNAKEKYAAEEDVSPDPNGYYSGAMTPTAEAAAAAMAATQAQIHQHNLEVQAFANQSSSNRPRARTAGVLDAPSMRTWRSFVPSSSVLDDPYNSAELQMQNEVSLDNIKNAMRVMNMNGSQSNIPQENDVVEGTIVEEATRALWLGSIPASTTSSSLKAIFEAFGRIESARVLTHKSCGFVNFETIESATLARKQLNGKEIFPGAGPVRIGFARAPSATASPSNGLQPSQSPDPFMQATNGTATSTSLQEAKIANYGNVDSSEMPTAALEIPHLEEMFADIMQIVQEFGASEDEQMRIRTILEEAVRNNDFEPEIPSVPEPTHARVHDAPRLREIRKRIDNNSCTAIEIEDIAMNMLPEIAELSSDYLGNTVVQKLFEFCSESTKEAMLQEIAPHLAEIGVHKNGTWAAQKIIDVARTPLQKSMIVEHLRPYGVLAFLDQYGNYVMQCCLRFKAPANNFIFETMLSRLWDIAQGRFGARAMRACLESHHATKEQQRILAAVIALHIVQLATNTNGALLLTWFLDTCNFPRRRAVLAPRIVPHLVHLCTHKVAYLTVLKIINQRTEPEARDAVLQALFFSTNDQVLEDILQDQSCGATLIFKILTTPFFDEQIRPDVVQNIRKVLQKLKAQPAQGYKRLMDEVGLSTRNQGAGTRESIQNIGAGAKQSNGPLLDQTPRQNNFERQFNGNYISSMPGQNRQHGDIPTPQRAASMDSALSFDQYNLAGGSNAFASNQRMGSPSPGPGQNQLQYQQAFFAAQRQPGGYGMPASAMNGYSNSFQPPMDAYRGINGGGVGPPMGINPMLQQTGYNQQPSYSPLMGVNGGMGSPGMWQQQQYSPMYMMPQQQQRMQAEMGGGVRRGRHR